MNVSLMFAKQWAGGHETLCEAEKRCEIFKKLHDNLFGSITTEVVFFISLHFYKFLQTKHSIN